MPMPAYAVLFPSNSCLRPDGQNLVYRRVYCAGAHKTSNCGAQSSNFVTASIVLFRQCDKSVTVLRTHKHYRFITLKCLKTTRFAAFWMPFTANKAFKAHPRLLVSAKDMHYQSADGRSILDGTAGLWCSNAGHCRQPIVDAIAKTAATMDFGPTFQLGHPLAFELASRLAPMMPKGIGPDILHQFGQRIGRYRAQNRARDTAQPWPSHAHPPDRARAWLSRHRLWRDFGRRHRQQPPLVAGIARSRPFAAHA